MRAALERVYYGMPTVLQHVAVSSKGLQLHLQRKSGVFRAYKKEVSSRRSWSRAALVEYQLRRLNELISHAKEKVPYYITAYGSLRGSLSSLAELGRLPILERDIVRSAPRLFVARGASTSISINTTGTTGASLTIVCGNGVRQRHYAHFDEYLESIGLDPGARHVVIGGRVIVEPNRRRPPFWRLSLFQNALLMSSYHLGEKYIDHYLERLASYRPEYIEAYPSSAYALATRALETGHRLEGVRALVTSAETLFPEQRHVIEKAFNAPVYDQYGCAEMCVFVAQCKRGSYHVHADYGIVEIVDERGGAVAAGEEGDVVCTGLLNGDMPLIRYRIGDRAVLSRQRLCPCGWDTPLVERILGRADDVILTGDGRRVGRLSPILKGFPVKEAQYVQQRPGAVTLKVVPDKEFNVGRDIEKIRRQAELRLGSCTKVEIELVDEISRGRGGKARAVVSMVSAPHVRLE